jgi:uncharacterized membrane protein YdjX (TVP38/TMEM64 family)
MKRIGLIVALVAIIGILNYFNINQYLSFEYLKSEHANIQSYINDHLIYSTALFFTLYVCVTAVSIPGATVLTLGGGAIFGFWHGLIVISFASTLGATMAFFISRFLLRDFVQKKFSEKISAINQGIETEGAFYLFSLRLIPLFPFFLVNLLSGLTQMKTFTFFWVSQLGMLPGTMAYVNAGTQIASLESPADILSLKIILSFAILGVFPLLAKKIVNFLRAKKS